jgi:hypothetical protein
VIRAAALIAAVVAAGAMLFGLWHVVVGGLLNGNPRAAAFGVTLAVVAGGLLAGLVLGLRRSPWRGGPPSVGGPRRR